MKKIFTLVVLIVFMAISGVVFAEDGFKAKVEPMGMKVFGYDELIGYEFTFEDEFIGSEENYGATYDPINLIMAINFGIRGELAYMRNQWGVGISGWFFQTTGSLDGSVSADPDQIVGIQMWDHAIIPVTDESHPSGYSPVNYYAENTLLIWTGDLYLIRTLAEKENSELNLSLGAKIGNLSIHSEQGQSMRAWIYDYFGPGENWDNRVTLDENSNANFFGAGPVLGFSGMAKAGIFYIEGFLNQSVLIGQMDVNGEWTDIDDIYNTVGDSSDHYETWTGTFDFSKSEFIAVPVTEFSLEFGFNIADILRFGIGGFCSIWWNAPVDPSWDVSDFWWWAGNTSWNLEYRNLVFAGAKAFVTLHL